MAKLLALTKIIMEGDVVHERGTVFDATPAQAKQFDKLNAARPATADEIAVAKEAAAIADGTAYLEAAPVDSVKPASGAPGDPQSPPKGK